MRGTFNPTRHGPRPASLATAVQLSTAPLPDHIRDGLTGRGLRFAADTFSNYAGWTEKSLAVLHEAARVLTELDGVRGTKGERAAQRILLGLLAALDLRE